MIVAKYWSPKGKDPYLDKHDTPDGEPYTPGESARWLAAHLADPDTSKKRCSKETSKPQPPQK